MWDLEVLRYLNDRACANSMRMVNGSIEPDPWAEDRSQGILNISSPEPVFPLAILASKLILGPPSLVRLIDLLQDSDALAEFLVLVKEFLPENRTEIMAEIEDYDRIRRFSYHFSRKYFPLDDEYTHYDEFTLADFTHHIPVGLFGFTYDDYEEFNSYRDGFILLLSLLESPIYGEEGQRVPILEAVKNLVGSGPLEVIPPDGWSLDDLRTMLNNTPYEGAVAFAEWVHCDTGCWQLDANYMEYEGEEWSRRIVEGLTEQWPNVVASNAKQQKMFEWLEEDLTGNFQELLAAMVGTAVIDLPYQPIAKEQLPLPL